MKKLFVVTVVLTVACTSFADRQLSEAETLQLLSQLTSQARTTWISAGSLEATHEQYRAPQTTNQAEINQRIAEKVAQYRNNPNKPEKAEELQKETLDAIPFNVRYQMANEYSMTTTEIVKHDGNRFYWQIDVVSRTDSVKPGKEIAGNSSIMAFNLEWNGRRIFAWDGVNHSTYTSAKSARVDSTGGMAISVNGALKAGLTAWGSDSYSYANLLETQPSAAEKMVDGRTLIELTLGNMRGYTAVFTLDPAKNYAVLNCTIENDVTYISKQYGSYQSVNGEWVPATILLENYEKATNKLTARDYWEFTAINGAAPDTGDFRIAFDEDAVVEYVSDVTGRSSIYRYSQRVDTESLLAEKLDYAAHQGVRQQNCATSALKYAAGKLGIQLTDDQLATLVDDQTGETSLLAMKYFAQQQGLYCRAVTTDIKTLKSLGNYQVILHYPGKNHFVVLDSADDSFVRTIDIAGDKVYDRIETGFFDMDWTAGTAFLISRSGAVTGDFTDLADGSLAGIKGAAGYSCTKLLQEFLIVTCQYFGNGDCGDSYKKFSERWGCQSSASGSCSTMTLEKYRYCICGLDPFNPEACIGVGDWYYYYMRACA